MKQIHSHRPHFSSQPSLQTTCLTLCLLVVAAVGFIPGCSSLTPPPLEEPKLPQTFSETLGTSNTSPQTLLDHHWWKHYNDATLNSLIEDALRYNSDLQAAVARLDYAQASLKEANGALLPSINLQTGSTRNRVSQVDSAPIPAGIPVLRTTNNLSLATSFEIDVWGRLHRASSIAQADLLATRYARDTIQLALISEVAQQYMNLQASNARLALLENSRSNLKTRFELIEHRVKGGIASELDLRQAESEFATSEGLLATERQNQAMYEHQLALLTGRPDLHIPTGHFSFLLSPPIPPIGLPSDLLARRPDLQQAEAALRSAQGHVALAKTAYFPTISLTGILGSESQALSNLMGTPASIWSIGLNTVLTVFDAGKHSAQEEEALAKQKEILANYVKAVHTAFKEVNDALSTLRENRLYSESQHKRTQLAKQAYQLVHKRYQSGYVGYIDTIDAQQRVLEAQQTELQAQQRSLLTSVLLFKSLGGGWNAK
jgi:outer membrane protein, multidrug efflux system